MLQLAEGVRCDPDGVEGFSEISGFEIRPRRGRVNQLNHIPHLDPVRVTHPFAPI